MAAKASKPKGRKSNKKETVFLIDCRNTMFDCYNEVTPFRTALKCVRACIANAACASPKDLTAIVFLGTGKTENPDDLKNIYILQKLEKPSAEQILLIEKELLQLDHDSFEKAYGDFNDYLLEDAFWVCQRLFTRSQKNSQKHVILFTDDDNPHKNVPSLIQKIKDRIKDLGELGVEVEVLPIGFQTFDVNKCYSQVLAAPLDVKSAEYRVEELLKRNRIKNKFAHMIRTVPLRVGSQFAVAVSIYGLVSQAKLPIVYRRPVYPNLDDDGDDSDDSTSSSESDSDPDDVQDSSIENSNGGLNTSENQVMKAEEKSSFTLLGFKDASFLKVYDQRETPSFMVANDEFAKSSGTFISALVNKCIEKEKVAVGRFVKNRGKKRIIRMCALIPKRELRENKKLEGFYVKTLPFLQDVRNPTLVGSQPVSLDKGILDAAQNFVQNYTTPYDPSKIANPKLLRFYAALEAKALQLNNLEEISADATLPDEEFFKQKAKILNDFVGTLPEAPKPRVIDFELFERDAVQGELGRRTVKELKEFCKAKNIECGLKKADIIQAIQNYFSK